MLSSKLSNYLPNGFPHGGGIETSAKLWACDAAEILDLSTGLHPAGSPEWFAKWLEQHASLVGHYPEVNGEPARSVLADELGVLPENVLMTAGAQAVIEVIFQAMAWKSVAIEVPCYNEPIRCAQRARCQVFAFERGAERSEQGAKAECLWVTSPSNPFGDTSELSCTWAGVLDESYMPFSQRRDLGLMEGLIRLGSLTKTFCIPGLRLGYVVASKMQIQQLKEWLPPWPASTLALHVLPHLLEESDKRDAEVTLCRARLAELLQRYGWQMVVSQGSFLMAKPSGKMPNFAAAKILVRTFPEWPQLNGWVRFGLPGNEPAWQRLEETLWQ